MMRLMMQHKKMLKPIQLKDIITNSIYEQVHIGFCDAENVMMIFITLRNMQFFVIGMYEMLKHDKYNKTSNDKTFKIYDDDEKIFLENNVKIKY